MDLKETGEVLAKIQAFNNRNVDEAVLRAWHDALNDQQLQDCLRAVTDHFKESNEWIMPSHIIQRVKEYRRSRISKFKSDIHLNRVDEANTKTNEEWQEASRELINAAAGGHITPAQYEDYQDGNLTLTNLIQGGITR